MNRRRFIELMGKSLAGAAVAYSFPSIIVPKNIIIPELSSYAAQPTGVPVFVDDSGLFWSVARDYFSPAPHRLGRITNLSVPTPHEEIEEIIETWEIMPQNSI